MRRALSIFIVLLGLISLTAQARRYPDLEKADYFYNHMYFHTAIPYYERIADAVADPNTYSRLADCYRLTFEPEKAAACYAKAVRIPGCKSEIFLRYGQTLMTLSRYAEAEKWIKEYQRYNRGDRRAASLIAGCKAALKAENHIPSGTTSFMAFNTNGSEFAPTLWKGNLVFTSDTSIGIKKKTDGRSGNHYFNLYSVTCNADGSCGNDYKKLANSKSLNIKYHDGPCTFTADGNTMYFTRNRYARRLWGGKSLTSKDSMVLLEIMTAQYDAEAGHFGNIRPFVYNSKEYSVAHPAISPSGNMLVFASNMPGGAGGTDLYICRKNGNEWTAPQNMGKTINTEGEELFPYLADERTLFFSSDGHEGLGGLDIYMSRWNDKTNLFTAPEHIDAPINSSYDDISLALFADGRSGYFSSNRPAEKAGDNVYFYKRHKVYLDIHVTDSLTHDVIPDAHIRFGALKDKRTFETDNSGELITQAYTETDYTIYAKKTGYDSNMVSLSTASNKEIDTLVAHIALYKPSLKKDPPALTSYKEITGTPEVNKVYVIGHVPFEFDKYNLNKAAKNSLDSLVAFLNEKPTLRIQIRAHTDCRGSDAYNMRLSKQRAASVVAYMKQKGIAGKRLSSIGLGSSEPVIKCANCSDCTEEQHYQNRILDFKVLQL